MEPEPSLMERIRQLEEKLLQADVRRSQLALGSYSLMNSLSLRLMVPRTTRRKLLQPYNAKSRTTGRSPIFML